MMPVSDPWCRASPTDTPEGRSPPNNNNKHAYAGTNDCFAHLRVLLVLQAPNPVIRHHTLSDLFAFVSHYVCFRLLFVCFRFPFVCFSSLSFCFRLLLFHCYFAFFRHSLAFISLFICFSLLYSFALVSLSFCFRCFIRLLYFHFHFSFVSLLFRSR
jgi:hypothetical protein